MESKNKLKRLAQAINKIDHDKLQLDSESEHKKKERIFKELNELEKEKAIKLLFHVIHAQQLELLGAKVLYDVNNPCKTVIDFKFIDNYCITKQEIKKGILLNNKND
jgi:hypothetical protein